MKTRVLLVVAAGLLLLGACTDATRARTFSAGKKHTVKLYSGAAVVGTWTTTGRPRSVADEDGWQFVDADSGKLVYVSGTVVIECNDK